LRGGEPVKKAYKFPLIGVGEVCQAHLKGEKVEAVKKMEKKPYVCKVHGPQENGAYVGGRKVSGCQECYNENRLKALRSYNSTVIRITATDKPWIMSWIEGEAKRLGVEKTEMLERVLIEHIPPEYIKAWYLRAIEA
jgi:hypothetical protein